MFVSLFKYEIVINGNFISFNVGIKIPPAFNYV
jgi:hypothetical protein